MSDAAQFFAELSQIAGICPNCGRLFRLSDARPYKLKEPKPSALDHVERAQAQINAALARLEEMELELREKARIAGLGQTKRRLKQIDRVFGRLKLDPHDAKVVFDPVEFVVFDGASKGKLRRVVLAATQPSSTPGEAVWRSIEKAVGNGNFEFQVLRVSQEGVCFPD